jgi:hypothetical protein
MVFLCYDFEVEGPLASQGEWKHMCPKTNWKQELHFCSCSMLNTVLLRLEFLTKLKLESKKPAFPVTFGLNLNAIKILMLWH